MNSMKKMYECPPMNEIERLYLVDSDEYLLGISDGGPDSYVMILHKPFNRWLKPLLRPFVPLSFHLQECYALPKPLSFAIYFYDRSSNEHYMMFYSISPLCDSVVLDRCVSLGNFSCECTTVLFAPNQESIYLISNAFLNIKEISMDDGNSAEIFNFIRYPEHWMMCEHTIYAVHLDNVCELRVCAFDVRRQEWGDERSHHIDLSKTSSQIVGLCSHRNVFLICYQQYIYVLDVEAGGFRYVDITHLVLPENYFRAKIYEKIYYQMLENGELVLLSVYRIGNNPRYETQLRVVAAFQPRKLSEIARRAVHESMPAETWKALRDSPLGDNLCLVKNLFTLMKPEKSRKRKLE